MPSLLLLLLSLLTLLLLFLLLLQLLQVNTGVDIETGAAKDLSTDGIMDLYATKWWAVKLATDAVITVLKVDQIIMAKQVGCFGIDVCFRAAVGLLMGCCPCRPTTLCNCY
jgi:hypothetical protein